VKRLGLPSTEVLNLLDADVRDLMLKARFKSFRRWWRKCQGKAGKPMMVV
jgi:hypothetical protein